VEVVGVPKWVKDVAEFTARLLGHLVAASVTVTGIWLFSKYFHFLWGKEDPLMFDAFPLRWLFDAADVATVLRFIIKTFTEK
jgi:hypothetical protein